jgi:hypothetical protein
VGKEEGTTVNGNAGRAPSQAHGTRASTQSSVHPTIHTRTHTHTDYTKTRYAPPTPPPPPAAAQPQAATVGPPAATAPLPPAQPARGGRGAEKRGCGCGRYGVVVCGVVEQREGGRVNACMDRCRPTHSSPFFVNSHPPPSIHTSFTHTHIHIHTHTQSKQTHKHTSPLVAAAAAVASAGASAWAPAHTRGQRGGRGGGTPPR